MLSPAEEGLVLPSLLVQPGDRSCCTPPEGRDFLTQKMGVEGVCVRCSDV